MSSQQSIEVPSFSSLSAHERCTVVADVVASFTESIAKEFTGFSPISTWLENSFGSESLKEAGEKVVFLEPVTKDTYTRQIALVHLFRAGVPVTSPVREHHLLLCQRPVTWVLAEFHYARRYNDVEMASFYQAGKVPSVKYKIEFILCKELNDEGVRHLVMAYPKLAMDMLKSLFALSKATISARFARLQRDIRTSHRLELLLRDSGIEI